MKKLLVIFILCVSALLSFGQITIKNLGGGGVSSGGSVNSVTGVNVNNSDPSNPVVRISVDGTTITGLGTPASPLVSIGGSAGGNYSHLITFNTQTSNYTLVLADTTNQIIMNVSSSNTLSVPLNSSVAFPIGTTITVFQYGAGQTTITPISGVTIRSAGARYKLFEQYSSATLTKMLTDEWLLVGDLNF